MRAAHDEGCAGGTAEGPGGGREGGVGLWSSYPTPQPGPGVLWGARGAQRLSPTPDFLPRCSHSASRAPVLCEGPVLSWQRLGHEGIFTFRETAGEGLIDRGSLGPQRPALTPYPRLAFRCSEGFGPGELHATWCLAEPAA